MNVLHSTNRQVLDLADRPSGVTVEEIVKALKCSKDQARARIASLCERYYIKGRVQSYGSTRYFTTAEAAAEWKPSETKAEAVVKMKTHWPLNLPNTPKPMHVPKAEAEAVIPDGVKWTKCPNWTHDPRVQCAPGEKPFGAGFAAAGVGRYLEA